MGSNLSHFFTTKKQYYYQLPCFNQENWSHIAEAMTFIIQHKPSLEQISKIIQTLNFKCSGKTITDFSLLLSSFSSLEENEKKTYQEQVFPALARSILETPELFNEFNQIPILTRNSYGRFCLNERQSACLLANMFMCTTLNQENSNLPRSFNFSNLYQTSNHRDQVKAEKISCLLSYFKKALLNPLPGEICFERLNLKHDDDDITAWKSCSKPLIDVQLQEKTKIEDTNNALEVDFANRFLGGGVLGSGAVQEEIQFITRPEQIVGVLFCESMGDKEAILIKGAEVYSHYNGYANSFTFKPRYWKGNEQRSDKEVVAIDAINFSKLPYASQFSFKNILRELNKAYVGFYWNPLIRGPSSNKIISTGNWGCGAFQGDVQLKFLIQWIAASRAGREKIIFHSSDLYRSSEIRPIIEYYKGKKVGVLVEDLLTNSNEISKSSNNNFGLFYTLLSFIRRNSFSR